MKLLRINSCIYALALLSAGAVAPTFASETSAILKSQTSYGLSADKVQQQEWLLDVEFNTAIWSGDLTAIGRVRWDSQADLNQHHDDRPDTYSSFSGPIVTGKDGSIDLRELYWEKSTDRAYWKLGKQQVVWGEADGLKLLDVINPQSFREFILDDFDDSRIPLWMVNVELNITDNGVLQLLWIPDTTTHELAPNTSPFAFTSPILVPPTPVGTPPELTTSVEAPDSLFKDSDLGLRFTNFVGRWDLSANYLYHYVDTPVINVTLEENRLLVRQQYKRSHLFGGTASTVLGEWTFRAEIAFETDRFHRIESSLPGNKRANQWSSVIGLDWQGWSNQFVSLQWFQTTITGDTSELVSDQHENSITLLWQVNFLNETLKAEWLQIHSLNHRDGLVQPKLTYNLKSNVDIFVSADIFYGDDEQLFGQFDNSDRLSVGFSWGF